MAYGGLSFQDTGCPVLDVGFNFYIDMYRMLVLIEILWIYHTNVSVITHLPMMFTYPLCQHRNELVAMELPCKSIERHTAHSVISIPNYKQWQIGHSSDLMMIIRYTYKYTYSLNHHKRMGKPNTHSPIYCMKYYWKNWFNVRQSLDRMYLTSILDVQYLQTHRHNDANEVVQCANKLLLCLHPN